MTIPSKIMLKKLAEKKLAKYLWIPETLSKMLLKKLPSNTAVEYDDLVAAGTAELWNQINRLYTDEKLIKRLWNPKKNDLTIGPFLYKGLKSPYPGKNDSKSLVYIKGAILDEMRKHDPATPAQRNLIKRINKFINDYTNENGHAPKGSVIMDKFKLTLKDYDKILSIIIHSNRS